MRNKTYILIAFFLIGCLNCSFSSSKRFEWIDKIGTHNVIKNFRLENYKINKKYICLDTVIIENTNKPSRGIILYMKTATYHPLAYDKNDIYTCPDMSRGSYYSGEAYASLVDIKLGKIINTVKIPGINLDDNHGNIIEQDIDLPKKIRPGYLYSVESINTRDKTQEMDPIILNLKDVIIKGKYYDFILYDARDCEVINTLLAGYDEEQDKIIVYPIKLQIGKSSGIGFWMDRIYIYKKNGKDSWKYKHDFRAKGGCIEDYSVNYDKYKKIFNCKEHIDCSQNKFN